MLANISEQPLPVEISRKDSNSRYFLARSNEGVEYLATEGPGKPENFAAGTKVVFARAYLCSNSRMLADAELTVVEEVDQKVVNNLLDKLIVDKKRTQTEVILPESIDFSKRTGLEFRVDYKAMNFKEVWKLLGIHAQNILEEYFAKEGNPLSDDPNVLNSNFNLVIFKYRRLGDLLRRETFPRQPLGISPLDMSDPSVRIRLIPVGISGVPGFNEDRFRYGAMDFQNDLADFEFDLPISKLKTLGLEEVKK